MPYGLPPMKSLKKMDPFDLLILKWIFLTLLFSLILGGVPWQFPRHGHYWIQNFIESKKN